MSFVSRNLPQLFFLAGSVCLIIGTVLTLRWK